MSDHIVIPGGTGFLGRHLTERLIARGDRVTILSRGAPSSGPGWNVVTWDARGQGPWSDVLDGAHAIVHMSGKRVDCSPTKRNIDELVSSRVEAVKAVGAAIDVADNPPAVWVQLSTLAIHGHGGDQIIDDGVAPSAIGPRQMVHVATEWESAWHEASESTQRRVLLRAGIAIGGKGDPASSRLLGLARWGLGGSVGSGEQWVSWIALDDFMNVLLRAIDLESMTGRYNVTSPNPIQNAEMMAAYRLAAGRRWGVRSPEPVARIGARLLGSDPALALTGRRAIPSRLLEEGFEFTTPGFRDAVEQAVGSASRREQGRS